MLSPAFMQWHIRPADDHARRALTEGLRLHPITAAVLVVRGALSGHQTRAVLFKDASARPEPFSLTGMEAAVDRIHRAVKQGERVLTGSLEVNTGNGTEAVQLRIKDVRPSQCGDVVSC